MSPKLSEEDKEARKRQIVAAAKEVFKRKGYERATLKDIVEEAGMSRGWIYLYYPDKNTIFRAMLDQLDEEMAHELTGLLQRHAAVIDALHAFFENYKHLAATAREDLYPSIYEYFIAGWREPNTSQYFAMRYERVVALIEAFLTRGIESGEFRKETPVTMIAKTMMSGLDGILIHILSFGADRIESDDQIDKLARRVEEALLKLA